MPHLDQPRPDDGSGRVDGEEGAADLRIVGHARSLPELWTACPEDVNVLIADLRACIDSDPALGHLRKRYPGLLVVTTTNSGPDYEDAIAWLAADGCVRKTRLAGQLVTTLRRLPH